MLGLGTGEGGLGLRLCFVLWGSVGALIYGGWVW